MSVLHQSSGGIGKSIPSAHEISLGPPGPSLLLVEHRYNPTLHTLKGLLFLDAAMMSLHLAQAEAACLLPVCPLPPLQKSFHVSVIPTALLDNIYPANHRLRRNVLPAKLREGIKSVKKAVNPPSA